MSSRVQQTCSLQDEAVPGPGGSGADECKQCATTALAHYATVGATETDVVSLCTPHLHLLTLLL